MYRYFEINESGHNIRCKIYYQDLHNIRHMVIFGHGFGGHKDNSASEKFAERLLSKTKDFAMVTFNWPSHGDDVKKKLCLEDCSTYLELVINYVCHKYQPEDLYSYATSFGGYLTLKYISEHGNPFRKVALRSPAVNMYDVITKTIMCTDDFTKLKKGKEIPVGFDRKIMIGLSFLEQLKSNDIQQRDFLEHAEDILILHGTEDEIVPFDAVYTFAENNLIEFIPIHGADHRFMNPVGMERAIKCILNYFLDVIPKH